jgi:hypothetical protein
MQSENQREELERGLLEVVDFYRGLILDMVEQELGGTDNWSFLRSRLLKAMGDRGLVGRLREVIGTVLRKGGVQ